METLKIVVIILAIYVAINFVSIFSLINNLSK